MAFHIITGTGAPTAIPDYVGQHYIDTTNRALYESVGTTSQYDWHQVDTNSFPPSNAPDMPTSLPGSDNLGTPLPTSFQWFRFVAPAPVANNIRLIFGGLGTELWSAAFYDQDQNVVGTPVVRQAGNVGTFLTESDSTFTGGNLYYVLIINHEQRVNATGTVYYTHVA